MIAPLFVLDEPQYHHLRPGESNRVRGAVLSVEGPPVDAIAVERDGRRLVEAPVNVACPELAPFPFPNAATCRFQFDVDLQRDAEYSFRGHRANGEWAPLFVLETSSAVLRRMESLSDKVLALPLPPPELVFVTQGGTDTRFYAASAVSGFLTIEKLLGMCGHDANAVQSVLDIGCGTGRLLLAWHADRPARKLTGVDINADLIDWNRRHLGSVAEWHVSDVAPPLPFASATFDVVQLASVFTHLPLHHQRAWVPEIRRLLKPGGVAIITLHGEMYPRLMLSAELQRQFSETGYVEVPRGTPGASDFGTFHSRAFATRLFESFGRIHFLPRGNEENDARLFPIAALQDVYVLEA